MKKLFTIVLALMPFLGFGQEENPYKYFKYENDNLLFDAVYDKPELDNAKIKELILLSLNTVQGVTDLKENSNGFTAKLVKYEFNYKSKGYKYMTTPFYLSKPFYADITILVKDGKYRVMLNNMISNKVSNENSFALKGDLVSNSDLATFLRKFKRSKGWVTGKQTIQNGQNMEDLLYETFIIKETITDDW